MSASIVANAF
ncbi:ATP-dependent RNA helicase, DEAD/DEAH box family, partial [Vibrio cholerae CP1050(23)]